MRKFITSILVGLVILCFTSCAKDDVVSENNELAVLSFGTVLNDLVSGNENLKQQLSTPACSDEAPAFVEVVLSGPEDVGTIEEPVVVQINPMPGNYDGDPGAEYFTQESEDLELEPGDYTLQYFAVYDGHPDAPEANRIWIAPMEGGTFANLVVNPLPLDISLGAGVKKYVDVEVLCFDDRVVNEYGYLFFDINGTEAIEFCVFGNYCDENGRHFPASFSLDVWMFSGDPENPKGQLINNNLTNTAGTNSSGDAFAEPVCFALPDREGEDEYYLEITLLNGEGYQVQPEVVRQGIFTDSDVRTLLNEDETLEYYHFRAGACSEGDNPDLFSTSSTPPVVEGQVVIGKIILPQDNSYQVNSLKVFSPIDESPVSSEEFQVKVPGDFSTQLVLNSNEDVIMLGYDYPGKANQDITATSTALGMLMNTPAVFFLSDEGKVAFLNSVIDTEEFKRLVVLVERNLASGKKLMEIDRHELAEIFNVFIESENFNRSPQKGKKSSDSNLNKNQKVELPVRMERAGRHFIFNNDARSFSTVIGVYKDDKQIDEILVEGVQIVPASLTDLFAGYGEMSSGPVDYNYSLEGDGDFVLKFRTGKPFSDESNEHEKAFYNNLAQYAFQWAMVALPQLNIATECKRTILQKILSTINAASGFDSQDSMEKNLSKTLELVYGTVEQSIVNCAGVEVVKRTWFGRFSQVFNYLGSIGSAGNAAFFTVQWQIAEPVVDLCFTAEGQRVQECSGMKLCLQEGSGIYYNWDSTTSISSPNGFQQDLSGEIDGDNVTFSYWYSAGLAKYLVKYDLTRKGDELVGTRTECRTFSGSSCSRTPTETNATLKIIPCD